MQSPDHQQNDPQQWVWSTASETSEICMFTPFGLSTCINVLLQNRILRLES